MNPFVVGIWSHPWIVILAVISCITLVITWTIPRISSIVPPGTLASEYFNNINTAQNSNNKEREEKKEKREVIVVPAFHYFAYMYKDGLPFSFMQQINKKQSGDYKIMGANIGEFSGVPENSAKINGNYHAIEDVENEEEEREKPEFDGDFKNGRNMYTHPITEDDIKTYVADSMPQTPNTPKYIMNGGLPGGENAPQPVHIQYPPPTNEMTSVRSNSTAANANKVQNISKQQQANNEKIQKTEIETKKNASTNVKQEINNKPLPANNGNTMTVYGTGFEEAVKNGISKVPPDSNRTGIVINQSKNGNEYIEVEQNAVFI